MDFFKKIGVMDIFALLSLPLLLSSFSTFFYYKNVKKESEKTISICNSKRDSLEEIIEIHQKIREELYKPKNIIHKKADSVKKTYQKKYTSIIDSLLSSPEFQVYDLKGKIKSYRNLPLDYYLRKEVGFYTQKNIERCINFIEENKEYFNEVIQRFNLKEKAIFTITSILLLEYNLCDSTLKTGYKLFNSLVSVYKAGYRSFASHEIYNLIKAIKDPDIKVDAFAPSSFMGAIGYPQLLPRWLPIVSKIKWRGNKEGFDQQLGSSQKEVLVVDLNNNGFNPFTVPDAIGFVAWYLKNNNFNEDPEKAIEHYNPQKAYVYAISTISKDLEEEYKNKISKNGSRN